LYKISPKSVSGGQVLELLCLRSVIREGPILQISNNRIPLSWRGIKGKNLSDRSVNARAGDVFDKIFMIDLGLYGYPQVGK